MANFSLKRGLNVPIEGAPIQNIFQGQPPKTMAVKGTDFNVLKPQMLVSEGDKVEKGTPLFCNKDFPEIFLFLHVKVTSNQ